MLRFFGSFESVDDCARVFSLEPAVRGDVSAAVAVTAGIHHDDAVAILQEEFGLTDDADAVVGNSVKQQNPGTVGLFRAHFPAAEQRAVWGTDDEIFAATVGVFEALVSLADQVRSERTLHGMKEHWASKPAADGGECRWKENQNQKNSGEPVHLLHIYENANRRVPSGTNTRNGRARIRAGTFW